MDVFELWDGNPVKLHCDDHYTPTDVINSLSNKKNRGNPCLWTDGLLGGRQEITKPMNIQVHFRW